ncbi:MAG TPA: exodeoxyribonuclease V subunit gamma [Desulfobacteraceae bacterium]|nr:exodeoxyribonuclease V subunit gamma [Desulfobacteraceae bacterium]
MSGLKLHTSNRLERLADKLTDLISTPLASPFEKETIVVQSKGMERWLSMEIARRCGVCANIRFPFPNGFVYEIFKETIPDFTETSSYDPRIMAWKIMDLIPSLIQNHAFRTLKNYLKNTKDLLKRYQLAERIADIFDQYLLFRPEMIFKWEKGEENHWQAMLWRELVKRDDGRHRAALGKAFFELLERPDTRIECLAERISVFGISALPRFHMQVLAAISRFTQVNLFLMNPCREYWGDIFSGKDMAKATVKAGNQGLSVEDLHIEKGNTLLASMGKLGRDFFRLINDFSFEESEYFERPEGNNLLSYIQSDILDLRDIQEEVCEKRVIDINDGSLQIHSCHSPMREMEVLRDRILDLLEKNPDLHPRDILVMAPDIETYTPYIQAVFDTPASYTEGIPFSIADRTIRNEGSIIEKFLAVLDLCGSRLGASEVITILESPAVSRRFSLDESDLDSVRRWVRETGIRLGIDGQSLADMGLPGLEDNTWKAGLQRLLLGYAMPGKGERIFRGVLPYDDVEGADASILGRFAEFTDRLFTQVRSLEGIHTPCEWSDILKKLIDELFMPDETSEKEFLTIGRTLNDLYEIEKVSDFSGKVDIKVIRCFLKQNFEKEGFFSGFITGGVTFCAMLPMRSIPFKVICLVGMNNDAYPRQTRQLGFDLIAKYPQPGDRSRRDDDRYLFLESILSAREILYISHAGQSIQDNSLIPPSVLVSELLDYVEQGFEIQGHRSLDSIFIKHRLQAFNPEYFKNNGGLFSYSRENLQAARCMQETRHAPVPFISKGLSEPEEEWKNIDIGDLISFFRNPAKYLLTRRLNIYLDERRLVLSDTEPFDLKGLERYLLEEDLVKRRFKGCNTRDIFHITRASGLLPHGTVGECIFEDLIAGAEGFVIKTTEYMQGPVLSPLSADLGISGFKLTGIIDGFYEGALILYRYARIKPKDRLNAWIHHLVLNCLRPDGYPQTTMLVGLRTGQDDRKWSSFKYMPMPAEASEGILSQLLDKYWQGLTQPLHFFPESSWEYVRKRIQKNKSEGDSLESARSIWIGNEYMPGSGECEDEYYRLCFGNMDPFDSEFQRIGEEILLPLMDCEEE